MKPCVTYARVSSEEQAKVGYSIPFQRGKLEQWATERDFEVVARFEDVQTAKETGRQGFQKLLKYLEENPEVGDVLVHRIDRLIRNHYEYGLVVEQLGAQVHSVVEPTENNAAGRLMHGMNVVVAKYHSDNLSQEVKKGLRAKFEAGGLLTKAPVGYKNIPRTRKEKGRIRIDGDLAPVVRLLFEKYATGKYSLARLADEMFEYGLRTRTSKPYPKERIRRLLGDPFYKGLTRYKQETRPGIHEALVSEKLWNKVQKVKLKRSRDTGEKGKRFYLLRGLLFCGLCKRRMTAETHTRHSYYRCMPDARRETCPTPFVRVDKLDEAVEAHLSEAQISSQVKDGIVEALNELERKRIGEKKKEEQSLVHRREIAEGRLTKLAEGFADSVVSVEQYQPLQTAYHAELCGIDKRLAYLRADQSASIQRMTGTLECASSVADLYAVSSRPQARKDLLQQVFSRIEVSDRAITHIEYQPPFNLLLQPTSEASDSGNLLAQALLAQFAEN